MKRARKIWIASLALGGLVAVVWLGLASAADPALWKRELEQQLGREIEFDRLRLSLFPRPALVADRFVLHERPAFGPEPLLYARTMECQLPASAVWRGVTGCSRIRLLEPSFNLTRSDSGTWNFADVAFDGPEAEASSPPLLLPSVSVTGGRVNFKQGLRKLRFALTDVRMDLAPVGQGLWNLELRATPSRTDIGLEGAGEFRVTGVIDASASAAPRFRLQADWPDGSLADWLTLVHGDVLPLRGLAGLALQAEGTPSRWDGRGRLTVRDLRGRTVPSSPGTPAWEGTLGVSYDASARTLLIPELSLRSGASEVIGAGWVRDPFDSFEWSIDLSSQSFDLETFFRQVSALSAALPERTRLTGAADFEFHGESNRRRWNGRFTAADAIGLVSEAASAEIGGLDVTLQRGRARVESANLRFASGGLLTGDGVLDFSGDGLPFSVRLRSPGIAFGELEQTAAAFGWALPTRALVRGTAVMELGWNGQLLSAVPPNWRGSIELRDASLEAAEFAAPLRIPVARMEWNRGSVTLAPVELVLGENTVRASLTRRPSAPSWSVQAEADRLDLADLHLLLHGEGESLLDQLVGGQREHQIPWRELWAQGTFAVGECTAGPLRLTRLDARGDFRLNRLDLARLRFRVGRGRFDGNLRADFLERIPTYRLAGNLRRLRLGEFLGTMTSSEPVLSGLLGAEILLESSGDEMPDVWRNLSGAVVGGARDGRYTGIDLLPALASAAGDLPPAEPGTDAPGTEFQSLSGSLQVGGRRIESEDLRLIVGGAAIELRGGASFDGEMDFRLLGRLLSVSGQRTSAGQQRIFQQEYELTGPFSSPRVRAVQD